MDIFNEWNNSGDSILTQCEEKRINKNITSRISHQTSEEAMVSSLIKIVTTDGKPFIFIDSEGFKEIMETMEE